MLETVTRKDRLRVREMEQEFRSQARYCRDNGYERAYKHNVHMANMMSAVSHWEGFPKGYTTEQNELAKEVHIALRDINAFVFPATEWRNKINEQMILEESRRWK